MNKISKSIIAGIVGTAIMTMVMFVAPLMGMPKMNPAEMLSLMMGFPLVIGWLMHFMIGIIFAFIYSLFFANLVRKVNNTILKGVIFGISAFIFAQIMMGIMGLFLQSPPSEGNMVLMMIGSIVGHIVFGISVVFVIEKK